jgi:hypothetical protein
MATAKSLVAVALLALLLATAALADEPTVRISAAGQAKARAALLRRTDFPMGWKGGPTRPQKLRGPSCPGFDPKESDLVVTGHASAVFDNQRAPVQVSLDTQVLETVADVRTDFARTIQPPLVACLEHQLRKDPSVISAKVEKLEFPTIGTVTAAYRATLVVRVEGKPAKFVSDVIFVGHGRMEYSLQVIAPARFEPQLVPFEADMARIVAKRGSRTE